MQDLKARKTIINVRSISEARKALRFVKTVTDIYFVKFANATGECNANGSSNTLYRLNDKILSIGTKYVKIYAPELERVVSVERSPEGPFWIEISFYWPS